MKFILSVLIVMVVLSIGSEKEGPLRVVEGRWCQQTLNQDCQESKCNSDCRNKHGKLASGMCNAIEDCVCTYPC